MDCKQWQLLLIPFRGYLFNADFFGDELSLFGEIMEIKESTIIFLHLCTFYESAYIFKEIS